MTENRDSTHYWRRYVLVNHQNKKKKRRKTKSLALISNIRLRNLFTLKCPAAAAHLFKIHLASWRLTVTGQDYTAFRYILTSVFQ